MNNEAFAAYSLEGKKVLVTGASSGIGRACAVLASRLGAEVWITGRNQARLDETLGMLEGTTHSAIAADIADAGGRKTLVDALPKLDGVVHSAGISKLRPAAFVDEKSLRQMTSIDMEAPILLTTALLKSKKVQPEASIVFISSISGMLGILGLMEYSAAKAAIAGAARVLAKELAPRKIRVNTISPGMVATRMANELGDSLGDDVQKRDVDKYPLGYGAPDDVARAVTFMLSPATKWMTGTNLVLDGGYCLT